MTALARHKRATSKDESDSWLAPSPSRADDDQAIYIHLNSGEIDVYPDIATFLVEIQVAAERILLVVYHGQVMGAYSLKDVYFCGRSRVSLPPAA